MYAFHPALGQSVRSTRHDKSRAQSRASGTKSTATPLPRTRLTRVLLMTVLMAFFVRAQASEVKVAEVSVRGWFFEVDGKWLFLDKQVVVTVTYYQPVVVNGKIVEKKTTYSKAPFVNLGGGAFGGFPGSAYATFNLPSNAQGVIFSVEGMTTHFSGGFLLWNEGVFQPGPPAFWEFDFEGPGGGGGGFGLLGPAPGFRSPAHAERMRVRSAGAAGPVESAKC